MIEIAKFGYFDVVAHRGQRLPGTLASTTLSRSVRVAQTGGNRAAESSRDFRIKRVILAFVSEMVRRRMVLQTSNASGSSFICGRTAIQVGSYVWFTRGLNKSC